MKLFMCHVDFKHSQRVNLLKQTMSKKVKLSEEIVKCSLEVQFETSCLIFVTQVD